LTKICGLRAKNLKERVRGKFMRGRKFGTVGSRDKLPHASLLAA